MKRALPLIAVALALASLGACGETKGVCDGDRSSTPCACATDRMRGNRTCCPGWTRFEGGACRARAVTAPAPMQSVGADGARSVTVAVDDTGRAALAWIVASGSTSKLMVAEVLREPAARLGGGSLQPTIAAGPGERITVAWKQERSTEEAGVFVSERDDAGAWIDPQGDGDAFSFPPRAFEPSLLTAPGGEVLLAWNQWADPYFRAMVARRLAAQA